MSAALETQKTLYDSLAVNNSLLMLLGGMRIHDDLPERIDPPYILFGRIESLDWVTASEDGEEHFVDLEIWSAKDGRKQVAQIAGEVRASIKVLCASLPAIMVNHHLINLSVEGIVSERAGRDRLFKSVMTVRAVTEPAST